MIIEDTQGSVPILLSLLHSTQALSRELWSGVPFRVTAGLIGSSLEHTYSTAVRRRHSENCFATVPLAHPDLVFLQDSTGPHMVRVAMNRLTACPPLLSSVRSPYLSPIEHA
ncbi:hypothetical protein TNCV_363591 [Trichonephila clavipes]|nr:hypothetical protein TNCV_363591 [Trichonephila clavipes]